jgi:hypothetical protein
MAVLRRVQDTGPQISGQLMFQFQSLSHDSIRWRRFPKKSGFITVIVVAVLRTADVHWLICNNFW